MNNKAFIKLISDDKYRLEFNNGAIDLSRKVLIELLKSGYVFENCFLDSSNNIILKPFIWSNLAETMNRFHGTNDATPTDLSYTCTCSRCKHQVSKLISSSFQSRNLYDLNYDTFAFRIKTCINCKNYDSLINFNNANLEYKIIGLAKDTNECSDMYDFLNNYYSKNISRSINGREINKASRSCTRFYLTNGYHCKFLTKSIIDKIADKKQLSSSNLKENGASCYNLAESIIEYYLSAILGIDYIRHTVYAFNYCFSANFDFAFTYNNTNYILQVNDSSHEKESKLDRDKSLVDDCKRYGISIIHINELDLAFISDYVNTINLYNTDLDSINDVFVKLSSLLSFTGNTYISKDELYFINRYTEFMSNWGYCLYNILLYNIESSLIDSVKSFLGELEFLKDTNFNIDSINIVEPAYFNSVVVDKVKDAIDNKESFVDYITPNLDKDEDDCATDDNTQELNILDNLPEPISSNNTNYQELYTNLLVENEKLNKQIYFLKRDLMYYKSKCGELEEMLGLK